jgi:hypothetical protein
LPLFQTEQHPQEKNGTFVANLVASTLLESRTYLGGLVEIPRIPLPETTGVQAA